jgi:hypothetical protein
VTDPTRPVAAPEHELKFVAPSSMSAALQAALDALLAPDRAHPENVVASLYYDTAALDCLRDKEDGQLAKVKVRLRWYEDLDGAALPGEGMLEVKRRFGTLRAKSRFATAIAGGVWSRTPMDDAAWTAALDLALDAGAPAAGWAPALVVRYRRRRYTDPTSGTRVSLDTWIRAAGVRVGRGVAAEDLLDAAVVEVKNSSGRPPAQLGGFLGRCSSWSAFSKYARCFHACHGSLAA